MARRRLDDEIRVCVDRPRPAGQSNEAAERAVAERPTNAPLRMAVDAAAEWAPGRTIRVRFLDGEPVVHARVEACARQWTEHANIRFDFGTDPEAEVRVSFRPGGSWSAVGTDALGVPSGEATLNLGWLTPDTPDDDYSRVVLHEFGHVLGCVHEHQNPAVEIPWDKPAVFRYYSGWPNCWTAEDVERNLFATYRRGRTQFTRFDPDSIMLYPIPNEHTIGDYAVGFNDALSRTDKAFIAIVYPAAERPVTGLEVDGPPVDAAIGAHREEDRFGFVVTKAGRFVLETAGRTDVAMAVFGPDSQSRLVADDDDSGADRNARVATHLTPGRYLVRVRHHRPTGTGRYRLSLRTET